MLGVQNKRHIQNLRLKVGVFLVRTKKRKHNFRRRFFRIGNVNKEALVSQVMIISLIAVYGKKREYRNKLHTLAQDILDRSIVGVGIIAVQSKHRTRQSVHHIGGRRFHYYVTHKVSRQSTVSAEHICKIIKLFFIGHFSEKKKIYNFLKTETSVIYKSVNNIFYIIASVKQLAVAGYGFTVNNFILKDFGNIGKTGTHSFSVNITESSFYVVLSVKLLIDYGIVHQLICKRSQPSVSIIIS